MTDSTDTNNTGKCWPPVSEAHKAYLALYPHELQPMLDVRELVLYWEPGTSDVACVPLQNDGEYDFPRARMAEAHMHCTSWAAWVAVRELKSPARRRAEVMNQFITLTVGYKLPALAVHEAMLVCSDYVRACDQWMPGIKERLRRPGGLE